MQISAEFLFHGDHQVQDGPLEPETEGLQGGIEPVMEVYSPVTQLQVAELLFP